MTVSKSTTIIQNWTNQKNGKTLEIKHFSQWETKKAIKWNYQPHYPETPPDELRKALELKDGYNNRTNK